MKQRILYGMFISILLVGCINPYQSQNELQEKQSELNALLIDNANIDRINACNSQDACEGWKCLCDTMASENDYCQRYEDFCVNNVCGEITKNVNGVNFMERDFGNDRYSGCIFVYDKVVNIAEISLEQVSDEMLDCLSDFRNNMSIPDWHISLFTYRNEIWLDDEYMRIQC